AGEYDAAQIFAVDGQRYGPAELHGAEPFFLEFRQRRRGRLIEPEFLGVQAVDQVQFAPAESHQLDFTVALDVQAHAFDVGKRAALRVMLPVIWIALKKNIGARLVLRHRVGAQDGHFFLRGMGGDNRNLIEKPFESGDGRWKRDYDELRRGSLNVHGPF